MDVDLPCWPCIVFPRRGIRLAHCLQGCLLNKTLFFQGVISDPRLRSGSPGCAPTAELWTSSLCLLSWGLMDCEICRNSHTFWPPALFVFIISALSRRVYPVFMAVRGQRSDVPARVYTQGLFCRGVEIKLMFEPNEKHTVSTWRQRGEDREECWFVCRKVMFFHCWLSLWRFLIKGGCGWGHQWTLIATNHSRPFIFIFLLTC